jgi:predicted secreted protein
MLQTCYFFPPNVANFLSVMLDELSKYGGCIVFVVVANNDSCFIFNANKLGILLHSCCFYYMGLFTILQIVTHF